MSRGWGDLAYHFIVGVDGTVYEARDTRYEGATGTNYDPNGHFLMALEGNFDIDSAAQKRLDSLVTVLVWAATEFNVSPSTIAGHRATERQPARGEPQSLHRKRAIRSSCARCHPSGLSDSYGPPTSGWQG